MNGRWIRIAGVLVACATTLAACGGGDEGEAGGTVKCDGSAISDLTIPTDFPTPPSVTFTDSSTQGPSAVADGYSDEDLTQTFEDWHDAFDSAGYSILFDEQEEHDAEISYKSADGASTGQVALRDTCEEEGRVAVHVTNRPA